MVMPRLANVTCAAQPFDAPEFRGLMLVGDISMDANKSHISRYSSIPEPLGALEISLGYMPPSGVV
jgi:hypothetical protein